MTMRAVAKAAGTTTPTVYERYRDRDDLLRALRIKTRSELFASLKETRTLREAIENYVNFALERPHAYEVLFDGVGRPPSLYERWPSFNLMRERLAKLLTGDPRNHNRLMMAIWELMHGTVMLIIRGRFEGALRTQAVLACMDAVEALIATAKRPRRAQSSPRWPATLVLGEEEQSRVGNGEKEKLRRRHR